MLSGIPFPVARACSRAIECCPTWLRLIAVFFVVNVVGDIMAFPLAHTVWNIVGFEGWFSDH